MNRLQQAMWVYDLDHHQILWCNKSSLPVWEAESVESLQSRQMKDDMSVSVARRLSQYQADFSENENTQFRDVWTVYPNGDPITLEVVFSAIALPSGRVAMFCETKQNDNFDAEALRSAEALLHTSVQITLYAASGEPLYRNPAARSSVLSPDESLHEHFVDQHTMRQLQDSTTHELKTVANVNTTKGLRWHDITALRCMDAVSGANAWLITEVDVSQLKATEEHAQFLAEHDTLTQLPNRIHVSIAFQNRIDEHLGIGQQGCLVFIDIDQFKDVNDSLGHAAGDQLLIQVAKRLSAMVEVEGLLPA